MPAWNEKDERQFEHIRDASMEQGRSVKKASEIAARTVNKQRRKEGRTPNSTTQGTGNPNTPLLSRNVQELRNIASQLHIRGRSKMNKAQLVDSIKKSRASKDA